MKFNRTEKKEVSEINLRDDDDLYKDLEDDDEREEMDGGD